MLINYNNHQAHCTDIFYLMQETYFQCNAQITVIMVSVTRCCSEKQTKISKSRPSCFYSQMVFLKMAQKVTNFLATFVIKPVRKQPNLVTLVKTKIKQKEVGKCPDFKNVLFRANFVRKKLVFEQNSPTFQTCEKDDGTSGE